MKRRNSLCHASRTNVAEGLFAHMQDVDSKAHPLTAAGKSGSSSAHETSGARPANFARSTATTDPGARVEQGSIKFFLEDKGYGFVVTDDGDLFLHISAFHAVGITDIPKKGDPVRFRRGRGRDGRPLVAEIVP